MDVILQCCPSSLLSRRASCGRRCSRWRRGGGLVSECGQTTSACVLQGKAYQALRGSPSYLATESDEREQKRTKTEEAESSCSETLASSTCQTRHLSRELMRKMQRESYSLCIRVQCPTSTTCLLPSTGCSTPTSSRLGFARPSPLLPSLLVSTASLWPGWCWGKGERLSFKSREIRDRSTD